jgi:hypothetical protein
MPRAALQQGDDCFISRPDVSAAIAKATQEKRAGADAGDCLATKPAVKRGLGLGYFGVTPAAITKRCAEPKPRGIRDRRPMSS